MSSSPNFLAAIGRLALAMLFIFSGLQKILTPTETQQYISNMGLPSVSVLFWITIAIELGGGLALALGIMRRAAALVLAIFTLLAAAIFHTKFGDATPALAFMRNDQFVHLMKNIAIAGGLIQVFCYASDSRPR